MFTGGGCRSGRRRWPELGPAGARRGRQRASCAGGAQVGAGGGRSWAAGRGGWAAGARPGLRRAVAREVSSGTRGTLWLGAGGGAACLAADGHVRHGEGKVG